VTDGGGGGGDDGGGGGGGGGGSPVVPGAPEELRELIPIPQKGLGTGTVMDRINRVGSLVRPYFDQVLCSLAR